MTAVTIYHNPRCSKSRQTLEILESRDLDVDIVLYLETPPDQSTLRDIVGKLGVAAMDIVRTGEDEYKISGLSKDASDADAIEAIVKAPKLLQRPIVVCGNQARVGRPPESVLAIL
ncbi:MAG: arsenate reductase (glutaredoxin) [Pseudomonadales bacterium]|nr:arsenate reductase (glutaredoxin) [Pseudomonadales bacterium]MBO6563559.1 arsenate reductase (glutaredoxin) [Pseudomonadales bacterium]MBO6594348.1 arsenate reductase (glutaredoxin) [Pseudomonadales bacterium]MBO6700849.1 arsenate reductase (glutaredoxin) [Pseudomonadales bacterium]MBO6822091.1 arsenate reductase (glutaredoxin) [Pseudomonadales bacterium]